MTIEQRLDAVVKWLNENYNQESDNYCIFSGAKPEVIRFDEETAISIWSCGAIVCIRCGLYFIDEDDGYWWYNTINDPYEEIGCQTSFSIGLAKSFSDALINLNEYVEKNGKPVYYSGTETICHYELTK